MLLIVACEKHSAVKMECGEDGVYGDCACVIFFCTHAMATRRHVVVPPRTTCNRPGTQVQTLKAQLGLLGGARATAIVPQATKV